MGTRHKPSHSGPAEKPHSWIRRFKNSDAWLWAEVAALAFLIPTAIALIIDLADRKLQRKALRIDLEDRKTQRIAQAWELVTQPAPGNAGKGPALEYLNSQRIELVGIDLSNASNNGQSYLKNINLSGANLLDADLSGAFLLDADLSGASLFGADLSGAMLRDANLSGTNLSRAKLSRAYLLGTNLSEATLTNTNLSGADLRSVKHLSQAMLANACGDENTKLPTGLSIELCEESR